jgi:hypothetical protein
MDGADGELAVKPPADIDEMPTRASRMDLSPARRNSPPILGPIWVMHGKDSIGIGSGKLAEMV